MIPTLIALEAYLIGTLITLTLLDVHLIKPLLKASKKKGEMLDQALEGWKNSMRIIQEMENTKPTKSSVISPIQIKRY